jgi:hypothetical protein
MRQFKRTTRASTVAVLCAVLCAFAASSAAGQRQQTLSRLRNGDTIRVWSPALDLNGSTVTFSRLASDTLVVAQRGRFALLAKQRPIPFSALTRVEAPRKRRPSVFKTAAGIAVGGIAGMALGINLGVKVACRPACPRESEFSDQLDFRPLPGIILGGGIGTLVGASVGGYLGGYRRSYWDPLLIDR